MNGAMNKEQNGTDDDLDMLKMCDEIKQRVEKIPSVFTVDILK